MRESMTLLPTLSVPLVPSNPPVDSVAIAERRNGICRRCAARLGRYGKQTMA